MADRWHPNDRRKIQRSLEIWLKTGRLASDIYAEQSKRRASSTKDTGVVDGACNGVHTFQTGGSHDKDQSTCLTFTTLVLWTHASSEILKARLDNRVEKMVDEGLLSEVESLDCFTLGQESEGKAVDKTRGIWVSIGYKEFEPYMAAHRSTYMSNKERETMKVVAIEQTKAATRQYAKRQVRWIRIKLINALSAAGRTDNLFLLDGSDIRNRPAVVEEPAAELVDMFLNGKTLPTPASLSTMADEMLVPTRDYDVSERRDMWVRKSCEMCGVTAVFEEDWTRHLKSKKHRMVTKRKARAQVRENREPDETESLPSLVKTDLNLSALDECCHCQDD